MSATGRNAMLSGARRSDAKTVFPPKRLKNAVK